MADLSPVLESKQGGARPVLIAQNAATDDMNTVICVPITSKDTNDDVSCEIKTKNGRSVRIFLGQIRNVDKDKNKREIRRSFRRRF